MRTCTRCNQTKEISLFPVNDYGKPRSQCKSCQNEINKARAAKKKEQLENVATSPGKVLSMKRPGICTSSNDFGPEIA